MNLRIKNALDFLGAVVLLIILLPVLLLVALAIKLDDRGPILFKQNRLGKEGKVFGIFKFRSMYVNADSLLRKDGSVGDNRITRVGRFIRKTSLDELPQLLNILRGEMSFIGPRPALPSHYDRYTDYQKRRLAFKPGVTGLAQVKGRNTLRWSRRIRYDNFYIEKYSLLLDMLVACATVRVIVTGSGIVMDRNPEDVDDLAPPTAKPGNTGNV